MKIEKQRRAADEYIMRLYDSDFHNAHVRGETVRLLSILLTKLVEGACKGHPGAIVSLLDILPEAVSHFNDASFFHEEAFKRVAGAESRWPVVVTPHDRSFDKARSLTRRIGLGARTGVSYDRRKSFKWENETGTIADLYLELVSLKEAPARVGGQEPEWRSLVVGLPPLSKQKAVIDAWWHLLERLLLERYGPAFETHRDFARHWEAITYAPKRIGSAKMRSAKQAAARSIYSKLVDWWLHSALPDRPPRHIWTSQYALNQADEYADGSEGTWQYIAARLPELRQSDAVVDQWYEAARLLNKDPIFGMQHMLSVTEFPKFMKNALRRPKAIRKNIKALLKQGLRIVAESGLPTGAGST